MRFYLWSLILLGTWSISGGWAVAAPTGAADQVGGQALLAVETRAQTQEARTAFTHQESALLDRLEQARKELALASEQRQKTQAYVASQHAKLTETQRRIAEAKSIKERLDPVLDQTWALLSADDARRPPWDRAAATARLAEVKRVLDDFEASPATKVLAVLNELRQRAQEVNRVEVTESELEIAGRLLRVQLFRLGGLAWYALASDGQQAWLWDPAQGTFEPMLEYVGQLRQALEIAQRHRVVSLVELPLPAAPAAGGGHE